LLVFVLVSEDDLGEGSTSAWIVHDVSHNTLDVSSSFSEIECSEASRSDSLASVSFENGATTVTLCPDDFSHD